jgi:hypothetical protein
MTIPHDIVGSPRTTTFATNGQFATDTIATNTIVTNTIATDTIGLKAIAMKAIGLSDWSGMSARTARISARRGSSLADAATSSWLFGRSFPR